MIRGISNLLESEAMPPEFAPQNSRIKLTIDLDVPGRQVGDIMLKWSDNSIPLGYHPIPILSLKGQPGATVLIIGGTHGDEFEGPAAIMRIASRLKPEDLNGQIILIPGLSGPAFQASARVSPLDGQNLNRAFPGDPNGGPTAMLAHYVETVLMPRCDAIIDLHSGGKASVFEPCTLPSRTTDPDLTSSNIRMARVFGLPLIWLLGAHNDDRSVNAAAARAGVPMIAAELGGGGAVDPRITDLAEQGLLNCLAELDIIDRTAPAHCATRTVEITSPHHSVYAPSDGLFDRRVCAGQSVVAGNPAGEFHFPNEPERVSMPLRFPHAGFVLAHGNRGLVKRGDLLALVAQDITEDLE